MSIQHCHEMIPMLTFIHLKLAHPYNECNGLRRRGFEGLPKRVRKPTRRNSVSQLHAAETSSPGPKQASMSIHSTAWSLHVVVDAV